MNKKTTVTISAEMPSGLIGKFMQHIRDFDTQNPKCHFGITAWGGDDLTLEGMKKALDVDPPFATVEVHRKQ
jgi:hypothetical protein